MGVETTQTSPVAFVTGATGFVGRALVKRLSADGVTVRALARSEAKAQRIADLSGVVVEYGDVTDFDRMVTLMKDVDVVYHVAAALGGSFKQQHRVNVEGTNNIARAARQQGVGRVVHVSSIAVYGYDTPQLVTEVTPHNPERVPYNRTKSLAERVLITALADSQTDYVIVRPGMIYGAGSGMWTNTLFKLARRQPTPFVGDGSGTTYPIYIDDVVDLLVTVAEHPAAIDQAFNAVTTPQPTWREFLGEYQRLAGHDRWLGVPPVLIKLVAPVIDFLTRGNYNLADLVEFVTDDHVYSMQKARDLLGWEAQVTLSDGVGRCKPYLKSKGLL